MTRRVVCMESVDALDVVVGDFVSVEKVDAVEERVEPEFSFGLVYFDGDQSG